MCLPSAFLLLCLPGYFTLSISRILKGTMGGTLVMECRYNVGEEGHRKFWCRGPSWTDCVRVIEVAPTEGQEVRRGRVTLRDNPREYLFHVITGSGGRRCRHLLVWGGQGHWCPRGPGGHDYFSRPFLLFASFLFLVWLKVILLLSFG